MNSEQYTESEALILSKVKQILNLKEIEILKRLMINYDICLDSENKYMLIQQDQDIDDSQAKKFMSKEEEHRKFLRKVPNFYLSMFKKWLTQKEYYFECKFLGQIRESKKSKQHRFELGDLQECFSKQHMIENQVIDLRPLFIEFLTNCAPRKIMKNNKATEKNKQKYIEHIKQLLIELKEEQTFKSYYTLKPLKSSSESKKVSDEDSSNYFITNVTKNKQTEQKFSIYQNSSFSIEDLLVGNFYD